MRIILAIAFAIVLVTMYTACWGSFVNEKHELYLIPDGYVGPIVVVLGDPAGKDVERMNGSAIFRISSTGVLKSQYPPHENFRHMTFSYVDANGLETGIAYDPTGRINVPDDSVQIYAIQSGWIDNNERSFIRFVVGPTTNREELYDAMYSIDLSEL